MSTTAREEGNLRVEITLSAPVKPSVETAVDPDRILLDFPNTSATTTSRMFQFMRMECAGCEPADTAPVL